MEDGVGNTETTLPFVHRQERHVQIADLTVACACMLLLLNARVDMELTLQDFEVVQIRFANGAAETVQRDVCSLRDIFRALRC
jgi:hypothetical protein